VQLDLVQGSGFEARLGLFDLPTNSLTGFLLDHAKAQVDCLFCFDHFYLFELNMLAVQVLEQANTAAKQHRDEVNRDFIHEPEFEKLRLYIRTAPAGSRIFRSTGDFLPIVNILKDDFLLKAFQRG